MEDGLMSARTTGIISIGMEQTRRRVARWRQTRTAGMPMPEKLWVAAVKLAQRHGVYPTARALGLEYNKLKRLSRSVGPTHKAPSSPEFVELIAPQPAGGSQCRIEIEGQRGGKLKIELPAVASADLVVGLCRLVWSDAA
jgi:hypothetical protein